MIEPARAHLMPLLAEMRAAAKAAGALGLAISGAGPTLCAVCAGEASAEQVAGAMAAVYNGARIPCQSRWTQVASEGARRHCEIVDKQGAIFYTLRYSVLQ